MANEKLVSLSVNHAAKAVLPNGSIADRSAVLKQLGLNPSAPPDAWLAVVACGANASALHPGDLQTLVDKGTITKGQLDAHSISLLRPGGGH